MTKRVRSYLAGEWVDGEGDGVALVNPTTEEELARASTAGLDFAEALGFAREYGGPSLGRGKRFVGGHVWSARRGVSLQINAFNFPAWGFGEKAACALLAGMPVVAKPAPATALLTERLVELLLAIDGLPRGIVSLIAGEPGDVLDHVEPFDVVAFTGSAATGAVVRGHPELVARAVRVNVEADSVNAAVLGPDVEPGEPTYDLFITEVAREITQKAGQKCTAIRRIVVPEAVAETVAVDLAETLGNVKVGNPALQDVGMGPLVSREQLGRVRAGLARLGAATEPVVGDGGRGELIGVADGKGFFISPVLLRAKHPAADPIHTEEVFGPVSTLLTYGGDPVAAAELVNMGGGSLVTALYSDKKKVLEPLVYETAPYHGRVYIGSARVAGQTPGVGTVHPVLVHGGPGRAGGGEELGGVRGLAAYMQRTAVQGDRPILEKILDLGD